ncbi:hypothetical protein TNCV_3769981 [Trichonephila clavipes]|nr:hypothetical protein TNCV_3769981 [Trichonephila clavipes]
MKLSSHTCFCTEVPYFIFVDDSARPHRTSAIEEFLERDDIVRIDYPTYFSDLNRIKHAWNAFERRLAARLYPFGERQTTALTTDDAPGQMATLASRTVR